MRLRLQHHRKHPHRTAVPGKPSVRRAALFLPNVTGCRYALAGVLDRTSGVVLADWRGAPGCSALAVRHLPIEEDVSFLA